MIKGMQIRVVTDVEYAAIYHEQGNRIQYVTFWLPQFIKAVPAIRRQNPLKLWDQEDIVSASALEEVLNGGMRISPAPKTFLQRLFCRG